MLDCSGSELLSLRVVDTAGWRIPEGYKCRPTIAVFDRHQFSLFQRLQPTLRCPAWDRQPRQVQRNGSVIPASGLMPNSQPNHERFPR